ncbi:ArgE/DapE family deacylase [Aestuariivirga sp.]|uniref:ArgE/DapE family deacylase n=1 Tax=Aestuariivirga sp. TaxID=2650926 RepID=UPI0035939616
MAIDQSLRDRLTNSVAAGFPGQVSFTQDLVRMPSTRGNEHTVQDYMARALRSRGMDVDVFAMDDEAIARHPGGSRISSTHSRAPIVVGIHRPRKETGRSLILQGHVDVVPEGPADMWATPPYDPVIRDGWMHGRGAGDMKAGVASAVFALDALRRIGLQPAATVYMQSVVEEESTGNGALMTHLRGYRADAALIAEPGNEGLTRANLGVLWFQLEVRGIPVHVANMGTGANAIDAAYRVVGALRKLEEELNAETASHPLFGSHLHPINLNIGKIEGGDWASSVPAWCRIDCRIACLPETSAAEAARRIEACVTDFARSDSFLANNPPRVEWNGFFAEGYHLEPGSEAERTLTEAHRSVIGQPLETRLVTAYLDARVYALYDRIPVLNYGCTAENYHGFDERVNLASVQRTTAVIAQFIADWCGVEPV